MKESKELCLKIYKNIKEKNSAAQLDNRFITYIQNIAIADKLLTIGIKYLKEGV